MRQRIDTILLVPIDPVGRGRDLDVDRLTRRREILGGEAVIHTAPLQDARVREVAGVHRRPVGGGCRWCGCECDGRHGADDHDECPQGSAHAGARRRDVVARTSVRRSSSPCRIVIAVPNRCRVRRRSPSYRVGAGPRVQGGRVHERRTLCPGRTTSGLRESPCPQAPATAWVRTSRPVRYRFVPSRRSRAIGQARRAPTAHTERQTTDARDRIRLHAAAFCNEIETRTTT